MDVESCQRCERLRSYCADVARVKRRQFIESDYWGKPVPGFGDPRARMWIIGLAPAAHGGNRTGVCSRVIAAVIFSTRRCIGGVCQSTNERLAR